MTFLGDVIQFFLLVLTIEDNVRHIRTQTLTKKGFFWFEVIIEEGIRREESIGKGSKCVIFMGNYAKINPSFLYNQFELKKNYIGSLIVKTKLSLNWK